MDFLENLNSFIVIDRFTMTTELAGSIHAMPLLSSIKWSLATINQGAIVAFAALRGYEWVM